MTSGLPARRVLQGEVLPPAPAQSVQVPSLPPGTPLGIPLLGRAKFDAQARVFQSYARMRDSQRDMVNANSRLADAIVGHMAAKERLERALVRQRHLPRILDLEEAQLLFELGEQFQRITDRQAARSIREYEWRVQKAEAELAAIEAERRLTAFKNPPKPPPPSPEENLSRAQRAARAIRRIKEEFAELRAALIEAAGGEANLTEEDRAHLDTLEFAKENQIRELMESL